MAMKLMKNCKMHKMGMGLSPKESYCSPQMKKKARNRKGKK
jgi:hypothetical protein